jgi:hypothetical protein
LSHRSAVVTTHRGETAKFRVGNVRVLEKSAVKSRDF